MRKTIPIPPSSFHPAAKASPIEGFITFRISRLRKLLDRYSASALAEQFGLTLAEWRVLTTLHAASPVSGKWLGAQLQADKAEISRACAALVQRGLAKRAGAKQAVTFSVSRRGRALHDKVMPSRRKIQTELAARITSAELRALNSASQKLTNYLAAKLNGQGIRRPRRPRAAR